MHTLTAELLRREVRVLVVGCGGNGTAVAAGLPYLHQAMLVAGHPGGLRVTLMDGDIISPANCVRQPFTSAEIGLAKAVVMVSRLNLFWGLNVLRMGAWALCKGSGRATGQPFPARWRLPCNEG